MSVTFSSAVPAAHLNLGANLRGFLVPPIGTGTGTSRRVAGKCAWFCTISRRCHLTKTVTSCSSGTTTTATPRTTLSANTQRVSQRFRESEPGIIRHSWIYMILNHPAGPITGPLSLRTYLYR